MGSRGGRRVCRLSGQPDLKSGAKFFPAQEQTSS